MTVAAVIVAGGSGLRAGGETPKQYQLIGGKPVIWWTLKAFADHPEIGHVQVVVGEGQQDEFAKAIEGLELPHGPDRGGLGACRGRRRCGVVSAIKARPLTVRRSAR